MDSIKLELFKNKEEHAQSAIASQEVREHLAGFIRSKRQGSSTQINNLQQQQQQSTPQGQKSNAHQQGNTNNNNQSSSSGHLLQTTNSYNSYVSHYVANLINGSGNGGEASTSGGCGGGSQDGDHPLRKTASMPTMHIPYKAQSSLSRRRQMERRITMSPLMKRRSKLPKRQLLHSQDSSSTNEYSSNPCIINNSSRSNVRSLSQSSSPPPSAKQAARQPLAAQRYSADTGNSCGATTASSSLPITSTNTNTNTNQQQLGQQSTTSSNNNNNNNNGGTIQQTNNNNSNSIKLSSIFTNRELENLQNNLKNSLYFSTTPHSSSTNLQQQQQQQPPPAQQQQISNNNITPNQPPPAANANAAVDSNTLRHMKVNEAIRKTVIQRASSRGKMVVGGSLDIDNANNFGGGGGGGKTNDGVGRANTSLGAFSKNELRQWSLDGADLKTNTTTTNKGAHLMANNMRDFHKLRLATTNDAATLRRSQSPSSSISMGLSGGQAAASVFNSSHQHQHQHQHPPHPMAAHPRDARLASAHLKHYSSSSSSTSSLLSQQDSLEESSSQAIDLSSSSEASRRRHQSAGLFGAAGAATITGRQANHMIKSSQPPATSTNHQQHYQKVLQESFNQLQLCQTQDGMKQLILQQQQSQPQPLEAHQHQQQQQRQQVQQQQHQCAPGLMQQHQQHHLQQQQHHPPSLSSASRTATSLDTAASLHHHHHQQQQNTNNHSMLSLSEQFNLSASAQNLISLQDQQSLHHLLVQRQQQQQQQQQHNHHHHLQAAAAVAAAAAEAQAQAQAQAQQQQAHSHDLNQWMIAYNNLIQSVEQSNQIGSSILEKIANLPEPYKSGLLSHLIHQQQQQQQQRLRTLNFNDCGQVQQMNHHHQQDDHTRSTIISRALSSPLLIIGGSSSEHNNNNNNNNNLDTPMPPVQTDNDRHRMMVAAADQKLDLISPPSSMNIDTQVASDKHHHHHPRDLDRMSTGMLIDDSGDCGQSLIDTEMKTAATDSSMTTTTMTPHQHSLDLTLSSSGRLSSGEDRITCSATAPATESTITSSTTTTDLVNNNSEPKRTDEKNLTTNEPPPPPAAAAVSQTTTTTTEAPLNFVYSLAIDPKRVNCSFIYNPVFNKHSSTGLIYELEMCVHKCICNNENNHPENSFRILAIWRRLFDKGLMARCSRIEARRATFEEIQLCHSETYSNYFGKSPYERIKLSQLDLSKLPIEGLTQLECGGQGADIDTAWNEEQTPSVARLAAGCVIEATVNVAKGKLMNAFAIVRPPGHHAEFQQAMGFCFFNSVAIAAKVLISRHQLARILIVDWDVHHGNGIQKMFYEDKNVMYISLHRHDKGNFFPGTGNINECGFGQGEGYNFNIAWSGEAMGDAEYLAAFRALVMPISRDFNPSIVLVACGFDAARGHPFNFGGYDLNPACFAQMTRQLMTLANGRVVLCLEGGYQLSAICDCAESCVRALLNESSSSSSLSKSTSPSGSSAATTTTDCSLEQVSECELRRTPNQSAIEVLFEVSILAGKYWPSVERWRHTIEMSALEAANSVQQNS